jgi:hypothetical protein
MSTARATAIATCWRKSATAWISPARCSRSGKCAERGWPSRSKLVEDNANEPAVIQSLRHQIAGFVEVNPEG